MFTRSFVFLVVLLLQVIGVGARIQSPQEVFARYKAASSDSERILHLGKLTAYYYAIREDAVADSIFEKQLMLAEETRNRTLICHTLFNNPRFQLLGTITRTNKNIVTLDASAKTLAYINRAFSYAKSLRNDAYVALGYRLLSVFYLGQGEFEQAFKNANQSYTTALNTKNDSVKVVCGLQLGATYLQQRDVLMAFKTYSNAFDIANELHHPQLLSTVYHYFSDLYRKLDKKEDATEYIYKSKELNEKNKDTTGLIDDYLALGKIADYAKGVEYLENAEQLAEINGNLAALFEAQKLVFFYRIFQGDTSLPIEYLANKVDLKADFDRTGPNYLDWMLAIVYLYSDDPKIAHHHFRQAEFAFTQLYNNDIKQRFLGEFASCYSKLDSPLQAIYKYKSAIVLCNSTVNIPYMMDYLYNLRELNHKSGDYKEAYEYSMQYGQYKDSLTRLAKEEELALMEIENLDKKKIKEKELAKIAETRRHNLQYMVITLSIAAIFVLLILLGFFPVSKLMVKILGFFAFILFFEFIILLADHKIHQMMHGEPLKIWLVKIVLLSVLLPLHHLLEEKMIHFLNSKKLLSWRERFSVKALWLTLSQRLSRSDEAEEKEAEAKLQPPE